MRTELVKLFVVMDEASLPTNPPMMEPLDVTIPLLEQLLIVSVWLLDPANPPTGLVLLPGAVTEEVV